MPEEPIEKNTDAGASGAEQQLEGGAYEIIRNRLTQHGSDLRTRLGKLNSERQAVFGAVEPALIATERVTTDNNCEARDIIAVGDNKFIFGYNVHIGLKSITDLADVFAAYEYDPDTHTFSDVGLDILNKGTFAEDFLYLYKYYRETVFVKFMKIGPHLYMAFRVGKKVDDIKCFKWLIKEGGVLEYIGNRFDHEYRFPPQQEFEWVRAHRGMYREGMHPHVSIDDRLFVETVGGDLTVKVEDNTESGEGIYEEQVTNEDQTLDDAEIFYAIVGSLILLKVLPYQEKDYRYLVYNEKVKSVTRIDSIANSCVLLPEDHGIIFSDGFHLQTGDTKRFDSGLRDMLFERRVASPNGEDFLYVFYNRLSGTYVLMSYNLIDQKVDNPIVCNGYTVFKNGELIYFRTDEEPKKHHALQVWTTPYMEGEFRVDEKTDSYLFKIGNAEVVRAMAECHEILNLISRDDSYADLYVDLTKKAGDLIDTYFWIGQEAAFNLKAALGEIKGAAEAAISEFDKVQRLRKSTADESKRVSDSAKQIAKAARNTRPDDIMGFVHRLSELRTVRGEIISLKDLRYVDSDTVESLEAEVVEATEMVSQNCVEFLLEPVALDPYREQVSVQEKRVPEVAKVTEADQVEEELDKAGAELEMLIEIVTNLKIEDATQTTQIIDDISAIYATLNAVRASLRNRRKALSKTEGAAQFGAQVKLINQAVINYLDLCETPEKTDEYLSKVMVQLEELEGNFSDFEDYVDELTEKRDEIYNAFESKKVALVEARNKRAGSLVKSAERVLTTIQHRLSSLDSIPDINGYLAGDLMVEKVRDIIEQLNLVGDSVKADDIQTRLKTLRDDSVRQLKDRQELFVDGKNIIQFGNNKFSVNSQELELSIVPHNEKMCFHLSGTDFFEAVTDEEFLSTKSVWNQEVLSENRTVYRAEYLAWKCLQAGVEPTLEAVQKFMAPRYAEGYTKGVHDRDGFAIYEKLHSVHSQVGLLRFAPEDRALALLFLHQWKTDGGHDQLAKKIRGLGILRESYASDAVAEIYVGEIKDELNHFLETSARNCPRLKAANIDQAAEYLFFELLDAKKFAISPQAGEVVKQFQHTLTAKRLEKQFAAAVEGFNGDATGRFEVTRDWIEGICGAEIEKNEVSPDQLSTDGEKQERSNTVSSLNVPYWIEAAVHLVRGGFELTAIQQIEMSAALEGITGSHSLVEDGVYQFDYINFTQRLRRFETEDAPRFAAYQHRKTDLIESKREEMRLEEFKPKVMSAFVRNKLLNRIYLPLIGDNLAKQMGTAGADTRTDRMGMLLLISPPGYGKTTLMEYVANRLGITFMKINGPAIGHDVTSLDPEEAPNASAREEVNKLNLSLEMGDNVMIYLDDIQHCNPEFLQKFISLCDAQRKIEGVWKGKPRTYDLRGKKVCVVMAGNPYTESGGKFQIPDMLANRADTYNLGDIIGAHSGDFEASYVENCLTSNSVLSQLASRSQSDVYSVMKIAETGSHEGVDFEGNYSMEEIEDLVSVMKKLMRVRDTILRVNMEYIRSAAMEDDYRTEPPFRMQGSYRNMNRIAEKILPIMTDAEVEQVIMDHYENESQTLTAGAEANLLKFRELEGIQTDEEKVRWDEIKSKFNRNQLMGGRGENDPVSRVVGTLASIHETLAKAATHQMQPATLADVTVERLAEIIANLRAVPVDVEIKVVPVHEGEEEGPPKKVSKKKSAKTKKISGKEINLPVDVEAVVDQKDGNSD